MFRLIVTLAVALALVPLALAQDAAPAAEEAAAPQPAAPADPLRMVLPPDIYAVVGQEMCVYFDNIILTPNIENYVVDVDCPLGRQDQERWRCTPTEDNVGDFPLSVKVMDAETHILSQGATTLHVVPASAGGGKDISLLCVGDSLTHASVYPAELWKLFSTEGNAKLRMIGTHRPNESLPPGVVHEGYGGWQWATFCNRWTDGTDLRAKSPFMHLVDEKPVLDFQFYCDQNNNGQGPDFITVLLGCNDTFGASEDRIEATIDTMLGYADTLLAQFQGVRPDTQIGILLLVPPAATQDAFGSNYKCGQTRWQYRRNQHRVVERYLQKYGGREAENIWLVPAHVNLDCVNNYPVSSENVNARNETKVGRLSNGVHPAGTGYNQIADSIYAWMKHRLQKTGG